MFKFFAIVLLAALVACEPTPEAKPDAIIAAAPLAYTSPLAYTVPASAVVSRSYHGNFAYPYLANYYQASPYVAAPYVAAPVFV